MEQSELAYLKQEIIGLNQQIEVLLRENHRLTCQGTTPKTMSIEDHPRLCQLAELVDLQRVQCVSSLSEKRVYCYVSQWS